MILLYYRSENQARTRPKGPAWERESREGKSCRFSGQRHVVFLNWFLPEGSWGFFFKTDNMRHKVSSELLITEYYWYFVLSKIWWELCFEWMSFPPKLKFDSHALRRGRLHGHELSVSNTDLLSHILHRAPLLRTDRLKFLSTHCELAAFHSARLHYLT